MTFFCCAKWIVTIVIMLFITMAMTMVVEEHEPHHIGRQTQDTHNHDQFWIRNDLGLDEALNCFKED